MKNYLAILFFIGLSLPSYASEEVVVGKGQTTFSLKPDTASECDVTTIERYQRYSLFQRDRENEHYFLVTQDFEVGRGCFEGYSPAHVSVSAQDINVRTGAVAKEKAWSFSAKGSSGEMGSSELRDFYKVLFPGCCGARDTIKYFSLFTGNLVGAGCFTPLVLEIPNTDKIRYVFLQDLIASDYLGSGGQITIYYSDKERLKQQVTIHVLNDPAVYCGIDLRCMETATDTAFDTYAFWCKEDSEHASPTVKADDEKAKSTVKSPMVDSPGSEVNQYEIWNGTNIEGVSLIVRIECEKGKSIVEIPVVNDRLSVDKAIARGVFRVELFEEVHRDSIPIPPEKVGSS